MNSQKMAHGPTCWYRDEVAQPNKPLRDEAVTLDAALSAAKSRAGNQTQYPLLHSASITLCLDTLQNLFRFCSRRSTWSAAAGIEFCMAAFPDGMPQDWS